MAMLSTLVEAPVAVQVHAAMALTATVLAPVQIFRTAKGRTHKVLGYVWVLAMAVTALSSFWIHDLRQFGPFSLIHLLSIYVLFGLVQSIRAAINRDIETHKDWMQAMSLWALVGAGAFTFAPGRTMSRFLFPETPELGFALMLVLAGVIFAIVYGRRFIGFGKKA